MVTFNSHSEPQKSVICENGVPASFLCHVAAFNADLNVRQQEPLLNLTCLLVTDGCYRCCYYTVVALPSQTVASVAHVNRYY